MPAEGTIVDVVGGKYAGLTARFVKRTEKRIVVVLDSKPEKPIRLSPQNVRFRGSSGSATDQVSTQAPPHVAAAPSPRTVSPIDLSNREMVDIVGGTYVGKKGWLIQKTARRVVVVLEDNPIKPVRLWPHNVVSRSYSGSSPRSAESLPSPVEPVDISGRRKVDIIGGVHAGKSAWFVCRREKRVGIAFFEYPEATVYLDPKNVRMQDSLSPLSQAPPSQSRLAPRPSTTSSFTMALNNGRSTRLPVSSRSTHPLVVDFDDDWEHRGPMDPPLRAPSRSPRSSFSFGSSQGTIGEQHLSPIRDLAARNSSNGVSASFLSRLPRFCLATGSSLVAESCPVCLEQYQAGNRVLVLTSCNHKFHEACADTWLQSHTTCPVCRDEVTRERTFPVPLTSRAVSPTPPPQQRNTTRLVVISGSGQRFSSLAEWTSFQNAAARANPLSEGSIPRSMNPEARRALDFRMATQTSRSRSASLGGYLGNLGPPRSLSAWNTIASHLPRQCLETGSPLLTESCAVCLEQYQVGNRVMELPSCHHQFHEICVGTWLQSHSTCPVCRGQVSA